jgi:hypothetical protein
VCVCVFVCVCVVLVSMGGVDGDDGVMCVWE